MATVFLRTQLRSSNQPPPESLLEGVEYPGQLGGDRRVELGVRARRRLPVRTPPLEVGAVTEAIVLEVVVGHLAHQLGPKGLPGHVLAGIPAADAARVCGWSRWPTRARGGSRRRRPGTARARSTSSRRRAAVNPDATPTWCRTPVVVVQAEQERTDDPAVLVPAESGHHAVGGALMLDLQHRPLVLEVAQITGFGHHTVETGPFEPGEPVGGHVGVVVAGVTCTGGSASLERLLRALRDDRRTGRRRGHDRPGRGGRRPRRTPAWSRPAW